jgi:cytochrome d ubiquinol oxidase subunit I
LPDGRWFLRAVLIAGPATFAALESGWVVTEVGRQPWIVYNLDRTSDAVTTASGIPVSLTVVIILYAFLGLATIVVLRAMATRWRISPISDETTPYGPRTAPADDASEAEAVGGPKA